MAISSALSASNVALEIGGTLDCFVDRLQLPGYVLAQPAPAGGPGGEPRAGANVGITPMQAQFRLSEASALLDWAMSLARGTAVEQDGAALVLDHNFKSQRRVEWSRGLATELHLPVLDAKEAKKAFEIGLSWQPASVRHVPGGGGAVKPAGPRRKAILSSNFRISGLPFDGSYITRVELPTIKAALAAEHHGSFRRPARHYSQVEVGQLTLQGDPRSRDAALAYVHKAIQDGAISDDEYLSFTVEMLDATMKQVLATLSLSGCALLRYEEDPIGTQTDKQPGFRVSFSVAAFDLKLKTAK